MAKSIPIKTTITKTNMIIVQNHPTLCDHIHVTMEDHSSVSCAKTTGIKVCSTININGMDAFFIIAFTSNEYASTIYKWIINNNQELII